jgi:hypothetical protein
LICGVISLVGQLVTTIVDAGGIDPAQAADAPSALMDIDVPQRADGVPRLERRLDARRGLPVRSVTRREALDAAAQGRFACRGHRD